MFQPQALFTRSALAAAVAAALPGAAFAQAAAKVDFTIGGATATGADGKPRALQKGSDIFVGDMVDTGKGRVQLRFLDGAQMALQPDTNFKVEEFRFAQKGEGSDSVVMNLIKGGMRTITGVIGRSNRAAYALKTPSATIGIRGTEFTAEMRESLRAFCVQGLIFLGNGGGGLLLASGQGGFVQNFTSAPQRNDTKPSLPTISSQEMEVLLKIANVDPKNPTQDFNPVVTLQTVLAQISNTKLTGTQTGNWAVAPGGLPSGAGVVTGQKIVLDANGVLTQFDDATAGYTTPVGTATPTSAGNDGIVAWGKWTGGTTAGVNPAYSNLDLASYGPLHYVVGLPLSSKPTSGFATYSLLGSSASCTGGGCTTATVNSSSLVVDFAASSVALGMALTVNGGAAGTYQYAGSTGTLSSGGGFNLSGQLIGPSGTQGNVFSGAGFLSGSGALRAGLAWNGFLGGMTTVAGANAYSQSSYVTAPAAPPVMTGSFSGNVAVTHAIGQSQTVLNQPVVLDAAGKLTQFNDQALTPVPSTGLTINGMGNDGTIAWGNWANGTIAGSSSYYSGQDAATYPLHYVVGLPATNIPVTGTATFNMIGGSASCSGGGCTTATVNNSSIAVDFGALTASLAMQLTINGSYGGTLNFSQACGSLSSAGQINMAGSLCCNSTGCNGSLTAMGFLAGNGATRAGLSWNGNMPFGTTINGVTAYSR